MKIVELDSITAQNFQGLKEYALHLDGRSATITAPNGVGKTTLASMYHWIFFGCDAEGKADNDIAKPLDAHMMPIHNVDTVVEVTLRIDGERRTFKRLFKEKWVTKKGAAIAEFAGHTNQYWIDGVPYDTERDFQAELSRIFDLGVWPCATNPSWFLSEKMKSSSKSAEARRREILLDLCGDVTEQDVIASEAALAGLSVRGSRTVAEWHKMQKAALRESEKERDDLPRLINENRLALAVIPSANYEATLVEKTREIQELRERRAQVSSGGEVARLNVAIAGIESVLIRKRSELGSKSDPARDTALAARRQYSERISEAESHLRIRQRELSSVAVDLSNLKRDREQKLAEAHSTQKRLTDIEAEKFTGATVCPGCGQELPEDRLAGVTAKFNTDRADRKAKLLQEFERIVAQGKGIRDKIDAILGKEGISGTQGIAEANVRDVEMEIATLRRELDEITVPEQRIANTEEDPEVKRLLADQAVMREELSAVQSNAQVSIDRVTAEIAAAERDASGIQEVIARIASNTKLQERVTLHESRQRELSSILEEQARQVWLCERYLMAHVALSEDRINSRFNVVRWKLFDQQINEGIRPCCIPTIHGSSNLSTGERILAGLDICNFFQHHYGCSVPVWIDYSESFTGDFEMPCQIVRLVALRGSPRTLALTFDTEAAKPGLELIRGGEPALAMTALF